MRALAQALALVSLIVGLCLEAPEVALHGLLATRQVLLRDERCLVSGHLVQVLGARSAPLPPAPSSPTAPKQPPLSPPKQSRSTKVSKRTEEATRKGRFFVLLFNLFRAHAHKIGHKGNRALAAETFIRKSHIIVFDDSITYLLKMPFQTLRKTLFCEKMQKNLHMSQKLRIFVRFLARSSAKAGKRDLETSIFRYFDRTTIKHKPL